jgi:RNA polymerase sigma factor (sigma-70 family)
MPSSASEWTVAQLLKTCSEKPIDDIAWQEFVRRYHATIRANVAKTFRRKVGEESDRRHQFPDDLIEDLVQAVYLRLFEGHVKALARFEGEHENSIYQYLAMISINVVRDHFREVRAQKRPKTTCSFEALIEAGGDSALPNSAIDPFNSNRYAGGVLTQDEIERALRKAMTGKNRDRDMLIFQLRFYEGLTLDEIGHTMGLDLSAISIGSILNRTIKKLRPLLDPNFERMKDEG